MRGWAAEPGTVSILDMPRNLQSSADSENPQSGARPGRLEHRLLLECARWAIHDEASSAKAPEPNVPDGVDWQYFARQARALSMTAPIYRWLADRPDLDVPYEVETAVADDANLEAHAWLESNGEIIVGGEAREAYTRLEASG